METPTLLAEREARPTPASTLPELFENLSSDEPLARVVSAYALRKYDPDKVAIAIPSLVENLHHDYTEVQTSAAFLLGWLGSRAQQAIPDLIITMENNENPVYVRTSAISALGKIGDVSVVPALARQLSQDENDEFFKVEISSAESIAMLTHQKFRDAGETVYHYSDGIPWIVTDARSWWEEQGQYQDWGN
jgi:HEAT repeat protein